MQTRSIACWGVSWLSVQIQMLHTSSHCVPMIFSVAYPASLFVFFQEDILDVISTASFLPPWFVYLPKLLRKCRYTFLVPNESAWQRLERHSERMVWIYAQREIHLQINKKIYCSYFAFNFDCFTSYFVILKIFCMSLLGCFRIWVPTCFLEVVCPRYDPGIWKNNAKIEHLYIV